MQAPHWKPPSEPYNQDADSYWRWFHNRTMLQTTSLWSACSLTLQKIVLGILQPKISVSSPSPPTLGKWICLLFHRAKRTHQIDSLNLLPPYLQIYLCLFPIPPFVLQIQKYPAFPGPFSFISSLVHSGRFQKAELSTDITPPCVYLFISHSSVYSNSAFTPRPVPPFTIDLLVANLNGHISVIAVPDLLATPHTLSLCHFCKLLLCLV